MICAEHSSSEPHLKVVRLELTHPRVIDPKSTTSTYSVIPFFASPAVWLLGGFWLPAFCFPGLLASFLFLGLLALPSWSLAFPACIPVFSGLFRPLFFFGFLFPGFYSPALFAFSSFSLFCFVLSSFAFVSVFYSVHFIFSRSSINLLNL